MKKNLLIVLGALSAVGMAAQEVKLPELHFNPPPRKINVNQKTKHVYAENGKVYFGIVVPEDAGKPAEFAAEEMAYFLGKALKAKIPVAKVRDANWKHAVFLGDTTLSRKAGLDVRNLTRDGVLMKTVGNDLYIAGIDEVGRGPLAGPVVAGAVSFSRQLLSFRLSILSFYTYSQSGLLRRKPLLSNNRVQKPYTFYLSGTLRVALYVDL